MNKIHISEEQNLSSYHSEESYTDSEISESSEDESTTMTELDDFFTLTHPELPLMSFFKRVFKEVGSFTNDDYWILRVAVHAIMLESGFVCFDSASKKKINGFQLPNHKHVNYTLPEAIGNFTKIEKVVLKFQDSENFVNIKGFLSEEEPVVHRLSLNKTRFFSPLYLAFVNSDMIDARIRTYGSSSDQYPENEVFEIHRLVNDNLIYPLSIDLCQKLNLLPPPCFMRLPAELKLKILELLDGIDIGRAASVCSELRDLCEDNELWRRKCEEEFGFRGRFRRENWKNVYVTRFVRRREFVRRRNWIITGFFPIIEWRGPAI